MDGGNKKTYSPSRAAFFEQFIDEVLSELCHRHGFVYQSALQTRWYPGASNSPSPDGYLPQPLPELGTNSAAFVEIMGTVDFGSIRLHYERFLQRIRLSKEASLVFVTLCDEKQVAEYQRKLSSNSISFLVVGRDFIKKYGKYASVQAYMLLRNFYSLNENPLRVKNNNIYIETPSILRKTPFEAIIESIGPVDEKQFARYQEKGEEELKKSLGGKSLLLLGNGVSLSYGSLSWSRMLRHMMHYLRPFITNQSDVISYVGDSSYSKALLVQKVLNQAPSKSGTTYFETIYSAIYNKKTKKSQKNSTLFEVSSLMHRKTISAITFNYDQYLEDEYYSSYSSPVLDLQFRPLKKNSNSSPIKLYHVHGFMPKKYRSSSVLHQFGLILNENDYDRCYFGPTWCRTTIKRALKNDTCLLIGLSLSDLYLRSLFRSLPNNRLHYSLMCNLASSRKSSHPLSIKDQLLISGFFLDMHVFILWEPSYPAIAACIRRL